MQSSPNKTVLALVLGLTLLAGVIFFFSNRTGDKSLPVGEGLQNRGAESGAATGAGREQAAGQVTRGDQYQDYSEEAFAAAVDKRRIYFFHAAWCPTCRIAHSDFSQNASKLPSDVVVFKIDYDTSTELKQQYGVTYQHTFVEVDENGELVKIWNGGGTNELVRQLES